MRETIDCTGISNGLTWHPKALSPLNVTDHFSHTPVCLQTVEYEGCRTSLHYPVVVVSHSHEGGVYLHHCALVRVAEQKAAGGFDQWNTPALLTVRGL